jgi:hypothetical protein
MDEVYRVRSASSLFISSLEKKRQELRKIAQSWSCDEYMYNMFSKVMHNVGA